MHSFSTKLVKVGNSRGVILPKKALDQLEIDNDNIQVEINEEAIILRPSRSNVRKGWTKAFKKMHAAKDDKPVANDLFKEDSKDWQW
jgi:antitoxin MazE